MSEWHFRGGLWGGLFLEHGDSRDDVTIVLYFRFLKKNKNKVVSNRCNRCVDSSRDHTNNEMASQYFFRLGKHTPRPDDAAIFRSFANVATISSSMATGWNGVFIFYLLKKKIFFTCARCRVTCRDNESTHELSYYVVRGNLEPGTTCKREGYGRFKWISSGTPELGRCGWPPRESGSRGASRGACRASRSEQSSSPRTVRDREQYLFCFVIIIKKKK